MYLLDTYLLLDSSQKRGNEPDRLPRLPARLNDPPSHGISVDDRDPKLAKHVRHRALSRCHPTLQRIASDSKVKVKVKVLFPVATPPCKSESESALPRRHSTLTKDSFADIQ